MNIIGIDPSITSTGMVINGKLFSYSYESKAFKKSGDLTKWYESCNPYVNLRFHNQAQFDGYADEQMVKMNLYKDVVSNILIDITNNIDITKEIKISIEGYSYGSSSGNLIDLVMFGTILRDRLMDVSRNITIVSPNTLKLESCKMTYPPIESIVGKRVIKTIIEHKNNEGISGGKFTKREMFLSIVENKYWNDEWSKYLRTIRSDIDSQKIPKPHEDLNDAYLLYRYIS